MFFKVNRVGFTNCHLLPFVLVSAGVIGVKTPWWRTPGKNPGCMRTPLQELPNHLSLEVIDIRLLRFYLRLPFLFHQSRIPFFHSEENMNVLLLILSLSVWVRPSTYSCQRLITTFSSLATKNTYFHLSEKFQQQLHYFIIDVKTKFSWRHLHLNGSLRVWK